MLGWDTLEYLSRFMPAPYAVALQCPIFVLNSTGTVLLTQTREQEPDSMYHGVVFGRRQGARRRSEVDSM